MSDYILISKFDFYFLLFVCPVLAVAFYDLCDAFWGWIFRSFSFKKSFHLNKNSKSQKENDNQ